MQPTQERPTGTTPAEVLHLSADYIAEHGWVSRAMYDLFDDSNTPAACAVGAIRVAVFGRPVYNDLDFDEYLVDRSVLQLARRVLETETFLLEFLPDKPHTHPECSVMDRIAVWNDSDGRTAQNVITTLRAAADDWQTNHSNAASMAVAS